MDIRDPHATGPVEAEVVRVRTLRRGWGVLFAVASAVTIFLCINQQFVLRFFVGFTPLNTEYYYALVLAMLPFVFVLFPASERAPVERLDASACEPPGKIFGQRKAQIGAALLDPRKGLADQDGLQSPAHGLDLWQFRHDALGSATAVHNKLVALQQ